jgi:HSP20 family molecular chaperone IbpA
MMNHMTKRHDIFSDLFGGTWDSLFQNFDTAAYTDTSFEIDVPGCTREDIELSLADTILSITWKRRGQEYTRRFRVSREVEADKVTATVKDGVLTVQLPRVSKGAEKGRKIPVT